ncbi:hypothetical protein [Stieleria varia]|uniref:Chromosome partition protein Smc n=1 Tax=Stieleria varia TaxID=2528005 RepID=A0A5C6B460_9BACT|nr:hypothetical protein [Stieleria varia]TWU06342.1 hypothetical protein Pla52n_20630 [Stieleria varia]
MNQIEYRVRSARRRLIMGQLGRSLCYTLFAALIVAIFACAIPQFYVIDIDFQTWAYAWVGGCLVAGLLAAVIHTFLKAPSLGDVAREVDHRFGLRERLSSSMSLEQSDRESDFGIALMTDAEKQASQIDVAKRFQLKPSKIGWLPLSLAPVLVIVLMLVNPASNSSASNQTTVDPAVAAQVKKAAMQLKKRLQQQKRKADAAGLKEARDLFEKMEMDLDKMAEKKNLDKKDAMIALNDLKKQLDQRRQEIGSTEQMQKAMSQMKGLDAGPADKVAKSMEKGEFGKASDIVKQLAEKMRDGKLSEKEKEQLQKQVQQMQEQMKKAVEEHKQRKEELQKKIDQARSEGRQDDAAKLQEQMNKMQQQDQQMQQMQKMSQALNDAAQAMQQGDSQQAADALQEMADQLGDMQQEMSELQDLESAMNDLSQSKEQMRCKNCGGGGCKQCQGNGMGMQFGQGDGEGEGDGLGKGNGSGDRPEEEGDTNTYETQVRGQVKKGKARISGFADGPNRKGVTREELKSVIDSALAEESNPLENQNLPRTEQQHAKDYFDKLRTN